MLQQIVLRNGRDGRWLTFRKPHDVLVATQAAEVVPVLDEAGRRVLRDGLYAAGFVSFDAAPGFDSALVARRDAGIPLVCLGLYSEPARRERMPFPRERAPLPAAWTIDEAEPEYHRKLARIREEIRLGNTYQINYTVRYRSERVPDAPALFAAIAADSTYAAYVELDGLAILSASPELFFRLDGRQLTCQPMKGTAARGKRLQDDEQQRQLLGNSVKDRAENVMITDMIRNDMGRIADAGSVAVAQLFDVQKHPTVWQMTSTVHARTDAGICEIFQALFPCASVTGAPKVSSMRIIDELEATPRGVYTGAIGYFGPHRQAQFNVAIRTATIDRNRGSAVYGVGGGIVWDSVPAAEYRECRLKSRILSAPQPAQSFELLETMLWTEAAGIFLAEKHLARLQASARYFDIPWDRQRISSELAAAIRDAQGTRLRLRLLLDRRGHPRVETRPAADEPTPGPHRVRLAREPVDRDDPFLYHKTTHRSVYERARAGVADCDDVLLWNADGYVTETTIANVFIRQGNMLLTPPVDCGLLAGTLREHMLEAGTAREQPIHKSELGPGQTLTLANSVRGRYPALLQP